MCNSILDFLIAESTAYKRKRRLIDFCELSSYLSKWDSNRRRFEPQSHLNNPWPTSTVPFLRDFPNLRAMPEGLELLVGLVRTPNYRVASANTLQPHTIHLQTASQTHGITAPATDTS